MEAVREQGEAVDRVEPVVQVTMAVQEETPQRHQVMMVQAVVAVVALGGLPGQPQLRVIQQTQLVEMEVTAEQQAGELKGTVGLLE